MIELNKKYDRDQFLNFLKEVFLNDFQKDIRPIGSVNISAISKASTLGTSPTLDLQVFEFEYSGSFNKRIALAKEAFQIMKQSATFQALAVFYSPENDDWRFSLMTANPQRNDKGNISVAYSNPRRFSFFLGPNAKVNTPNKFLIKKGMVVDFNDLKNRFSLEVVNKEFYKEISESFTKLIGGTRGEGRNKVAYESLLKLPSVNDHSQTSIEFGVRLIGRLIFCWFLREKIGISGSALMPKALLSLEAISKNSDYYHKILEPIFFEILNKPIKSRRDPFLSDLFSLIPYLNGGLFSPHDDDFFSYNEGKREQYHNTVVVPDEWIQDFFIILETYNFTIDENTSIDEELSIDPEMLGRIFENLLAEINPETGESARKSTGSYYTPRVIVDYMVDESLLLYLKQHTSINEEELRAIISYDLSDDAKHPLSENEKIELVDAIEKVKILDPACGSGAYPIGALQKIVFILQQVDPDGHFWFQKQIQRTSPEIRRVLEREFSHKNFDYIRKLGVIRENIYGIDIQPIATEISRLRCFLTLVVDERIDDSLDNRGVEPLPNLDFKFVTANSLIGLPGSNKKNQMGLFEDTEGINELREIREMFFNASGTEREQLKLQFVQTQNKMFQKLISENRRGHADLTTMLTTWDPFSHKMSSWFDPEWMFGIKEGFDITIANPPYFQIQKMPEDAKKILATLYSTFTKAGDIYCLFYEKSIQLLKRDGISCFITSNSWMKTKYGLLLRNFLLSNSNPLELINFEDSQIFSSAIVETNILITKKSNWEGKLLAINVENTFINYQSLTGYINDNKTILENLDNEGWIIGNSKVLKLKKKIENQSQNLKSLGYSINFGIKTGFNEAFIIDENTKNKLCEEDPLSINIIKPLLRGRDIKKWGYSFNQKYLINSHNGTRATGIKAVNVSEYPAIFRYLNEYKNELIKRQDKGDHWTNLRNCAYLEEFEKEKIIWGELSDKPKFAFDNKKYFAEATLFFMTGNNLKYILALLNSTLSSWYFNLISTSSGMGTNRWKKYKIEAFPVKIPENEFKKNIEEIVDDILLIISNDNNDGDVITKIKVKENMIDQLIYQFYDLNEEEIEIVEGKND